jgi:hypothetical protein
VQGGGGRCLVGLAKAFWTTEAEKQKKQHNKRQYLQSAASLFTFWQLPTPVQHIDFFYHSEGIAH